MSEIAELRKKIDDARVEHAGVFGAMNVLVTQATNGTERALNLLDTMRADLARRDLDAAKKEHAISSEIAEIQNGLTTIKALQQSLKDGLDELEKKNSEEKKTNKTAVVAIVVAVISGATHVVTALLGN